jgi:hypothetical protein
MDNERFAKREFIVADVCGIEVSTEFLHPDYILSGIKPDAKVGGTGRLELFRLDAIAKGLPSFLIRIGHDDHEAVDIDLIGGEPERAAFVKGKPGYVGHHTLNLNTNPRSYKLEVEIPLVGRVFSGTVTMHGLGLGLRLGFKSVPNVMMDAVVIRRNEEQS